MKKTSIELFHLYYTGARSISDMAGEVFANVQRSKAFSEEYSHHAVRMVMLDDQHVGRRERASFFAPVIAQMPAMQVDFITFERDLNYLKEEWLATQTNADELRKTIKKVYNGNLDCSHYIAIWYMARLGLLEDKGVFIPVSSRAIFGQVEPTADFLINHIPVKYKDVEDATEAGILRCNIHVDFILPVIQRMYYVE
jgi:hypothetical protein